VSEKTPIPPNSDLPAELSSPALRALLGAGYTQLVQLTKVSEPEIAALHGMGPKGIRILNAALAERGLSFAKRRK
jgi:hypothetical protein